jgi:hypothetical protein
MKKIKCYRVHCVGNIFHFSIFSWIAERSGRRACYLSLWIIGWRWVVIQPTTNNKKLLLVGKKKNSDKYLEGGEKTR